MSSVAGEDKRFWTCRIAKTGQSEASTLHCGYQRLLSRALLSTSSFHELWVNRNLLATL